MPEQKSCSFSVQFQIFSFSLWSQFHLSQSGINYDWCEKHKPDLSDLSWSLEVELKEGTDSDTQLDSAKWIHVVLKDLDFLEEINQKDFEDISRATLVDQTKQQRKDFPLLPEMIFEPWSFIKMTSH